MPNPKIITDRANPINVRDAARRTSEAIRGPRLLYRDTSHPDTGSPARELSGINSKSVPSWASFKSNSVLTVGIRDAQVEKQKPERKKNTLI